MLILLRRNRKKRYATIVNNNSNAGFGRGNKYIKEFLLRKIKGGGGLYGDPGAGRARRARGQWEAAHASKRADWAAKGHSRGVLLVEAVASGTAVRSGSDAARRGAATTAQPGGRGGERRRKRRAWRPSSQGSREGPRGSSAAGMCGCDAARSARRAQPGQRQAGLGRHRGRLVGFGEARRGPAGPRGRWSPAWRGCGSGRRSVRKSHFSAGISPFRFSPVRRRRPPRPGPGGAARGPTGAASSGGGAAPQAGAAG